MGQRVVSNDPLLAPLVDEMLRKSVVELCPEPRFRARIFTVPKPDGRRRLILDVSPLNKAIVVRPFSLPSASDLRALLPQSAFMAKIDLTEAYWHIPIHPFFRRYLAFHFQGRDYQFRAMPFGLSVAPIAFTAVMRHPYRLLKERGHLALNYLDDWIVWASSFQACELAVQDLLSILGEIGFLVNKEKSHLVPTQSLDWLGIHWDTRMPSLSLPFSSAEKLTLKVKELSLASVASRRRIESLLGSMAFLGQWLPEAKWAFYRFLPALAHFPPSRDITVPFLPHLKVDLAWWLVAQNLTRPVALRPPKDSIWLWTDASDEGWGGHIGDGISVWGQWSTSESTLHINLKEIRAVRLALVQLNPPSSRRIVVSVDNVTAAFALRSWGLQEVPLSSHRSETTSRSLPVEELVVRGSENSISVECPSRRSLQGLSSSVRVVPSSSLQGPSLCLGRDSGRRPLGDSVQSATSSVCLPLPPSRGECSGRAGSELERLGFSLPVSSSGPVGEISSPSRHVLREGYPNPQSQPVVPSLVSVGEEAPSEPAITGATGSVREGCLGARRVGEIVAMDCHSFLSSSLSSSLNPRVARWVINGRRSSSRRQREVAWNQLRLFLADVPESQPFSKTLALEFLISCLEDKGLRSSTVRAYRISLSLPLRLAGVELSEWEFEEVLRAGFIANPPASKRFPSWNLGKVLDSLRNHPQNDLEFLEKILFLTALASGNRVSELAALRADTVRFTEEGVYLAVRPGFLYKNQKEGRTPPNIFIPSLPSDPALCPVRWLRRYVERFHKVSGSLFTNTRSGAALSAASIASLLCRTIDRADPGTLPRSHDIRRKATSLAWVWGVPPLEICRRGFWASSSAFIQRYLDSSILETSGVALGSLPPS